MSLNTFDQFLQRYHTKHFSKGELIFVQGEIPSCAYVIKRGVVKVYNLTSRGEEKPISYDIQHESFPIGWTFSKMSESQFFYDAYTDVELYCIPRSDYQDFLRQNPDVLYEIHSLFIRHYVHMQTRINALEQSKAAAKVVNTIHYLCLRYGKDIKKDTVKIQLPMTQQELANFMGLTRETTGIELKRLQREHVLTYRSQNYVVDTSRLNDLLDEEYIQAKVD
jgi:CRP-like cAMP-binding protein